MNKLMIGAAFAAAALGASAESVYNLSITAKVPEKTTGTAATYVKQATVKMTGLVVENEYILWTGSGKKAEIADSGIIGNPSSADVNKSKVLWSGEIAGYDMRGYGSEKSLSGNFTGAQYAYGSWSAKENTSTEKKLAQGKTLTEAYKFPAGIADEVEAWLADDTEWEHLINNATTLDDYAAIAEKALEVSQSNFDAASNALVEAYTVYTNSTADIGKELVALKKNYNAAVDAYYNFPDWKPADSKKEDLKFAEATNSLAETTVQVDYWKGENDLDIAAYADATNSIESQISDLKYDTKLHPGNKAKNDAEIAKLTAQKTSCDEYVNMTNSTAQLGIMVAATNELQATAISVSNAYVTCETLLRGYAKDYFDTLDEEGQKTWKYLDADGNIISKSNFSECFENGYNAKYNVVVASKNTKQWTITETIKKGGVILAGEYYMTVDDYKDGLSTPYRADEDTRAPEDVYIFEKGDYLQAVDAACKAAKELCASKTLDTEVQLKQDAVAKGADEAKAVKEIENWGSYQETNYEYAKVGPKFDGELFEYVDSYLFEGAKAGVNFGGYSLLVIKDIVEVDAE